MTSRRNALLFAPISLVLLGLSTARGDDQVVPSSDDEADTATELERVEVLGSRIRRADWETADPVLVIERAEIERMAIPTLGELLQSLTLHGSALNTTVNNGGDGTTRINLRNLGDQRTLVLLDGRRFTSGIDGAADLNSIPLAIIERIEVLKDGASALYGTDAIAGVVNIATRRELGGTELAVQSGQFTDRDGLGQSIHLGHGWQTDMVRTVFGVNHLDQAPIFAGDRDISAAPTFGLPPNSVFAGASPFNENGLIGFGSRGICPFDPTGAYPANGICTSPDGRPPPLNRMTFDPTTDSYRRFEPTTDGYNFAPENYLRTPQQLSAGFLNAEAEVSGNLRLGVQMFMNQRRSRQQLAPNPIMVGVLQPGGNRFPIPADHVYNPFGQPVTFLGLRPGGQVRQFAQDADTRRLAIQAVGNFSVRDRWFDFDVGAMAADYDIESASTGLVDPSRLRLALGPSFRDASGRAVCGTPAAPIAGCVPFNPFAGVDGFDEAMLDYLYFEGVDRTTTRTQQIHANVSGSPLDLPAGPLGLAMGVEQRRDDGISRLDARRVSTLGLVDNSFEGDQRVREAFVEVAAPLLADVTAVQSLELTAAMRHSRYRTFGNTNNGEVGLRWAPTDGWLVRVSAADGFRAPTVTELFFPGAEGLTGAQDPCSSEANPDSVRRANCAADGVPGGVYDRPINTAVVQTGGNDLLQPEQSRSRSVGIVFSPSQWPGFSGAIDHYAVDLEDAISEVSAEALLSVCADTGLAGACDRTIRGPSGELVGIDARQLNLGRLELSGTDLSLDYRRDTRWGTLDLNLEASHYSRYRIEVPEGAPARDLLGQYALGIPGFRHRANLRVALESGNWRAGLVSRWYPGLDEACLVPLNFGAPELCSDPETPSGIEPGLPLNRLGARVYHDVTLSWRTPWSATVQLGVRNVLDRDPPVSYSGVANSFLPVYPVPGRFWQLEWRQTF